MKLFLGPRTPNDDRSDSLNSNSDANKDEMDNRSNIQNPNNKNYDENYNSS